MSDTLIPLSTITDVSKLLTQPRETPIGTQPEDDKQVQACLTDAVNFFHGNLTPDIRRHIRSKWGISDTTIDKFKIGYTDPESPTDPTLLDHLREQGHDDFTILRTGLVSHQGFKHVFSCDPLDPDSRCYHTVPDPVELLSALQSQSTNQQDYPYYDFIKPRKISVEKLSQAFLDNNDGSGGLDLSFWWEHRITFPYLSQDGSRFQYLIGRATDETHDKVYGSNIVDLMGGDQSTVTISLTTVNNNIPVFDPPAVAVPIGTEITFDTPLDLDPEIDVKHSADGEWDSHRLSEFHETCSQGGTYLYRIQSDDGDIRGAILATDSFNDGDPYGPISDWLENTINYELDRAKYLKQSKNSPWVNNRTVWEPMFGAHTVLEDKSLLLTEGITDALVALQNDIPCVSPCTTQFKAKHYPDLISICSDVKNVYIVMDNDDNDSGTDGALRTARVLEKNGIDALVGTLPKPNSVESMDLAKFLKSRSKEEFLSVLKDSIPPEEHAHYDPNIHDPGELRQDNSGAVTTSSTTSTQTAASSDFDADGNNSHSHSAIYNLTIPAAAKSLPSSGGSTSILARGGNPLFDSKYDNSFVLINEHLAHEHWKCKATYNPLTWLACEAGVRDPRAPSGTFSDKEIWQVWKYANTAEHVTHPDPDKDWENDSIPVRAIYYLARKHNVLPDDSIPDSYDDGRLPPTAYNYVLSIVEEEYGINPGRDQLDRGHSINNNSDSDPEF
jgi:hypothetical protein